MKFTVTNTITQETFSGLTKREKDAIFKRELQKNGWYAACDEHRATCREDASHIKKYGLPWNWNSKKNDAACKKQSDIFDSIKVFVER